MRRTPMPARTAPLRRVGITRGGGSAVTRPVGPPALTRTTLRQVSRKRAAAQPTRAAAVAALRAAGDWCARCGTPGGPGITDGHERLARAHGGDPAKPDMLACRPCNTWFEDHPEQAAWEGWKTSSKHPTAACITAGRCAYGAHPLGIECKEEPA